VVCIHAEDYTYPQLGRKLTGRMIDESLSSMHGDAKFIWNEEARLLVCKIGIPNNSTLRVKLVPQLSDPPI